MIDYIQNSKILYDDNILNIETERLFREAEDDFYFFNKSKKVINKLTKALELSPCRIKVLKLLGDVYFANGKMEKCFDCYSQAAALKPENAVILASLASVCEAVGKFSTALDFTNLALKHLTIEDIRLFAPLTELKISLLVKLQMYNEAKKVLDFAKKRLSSEEVGSLATVSLLKKKLSLREKIDNLNIKVV